MATFVSKQIAVPSLGKMASDYAVGSSVFIPVNGANIEFLVVHQGNPSTSIYDSSCNGTWLLMKDCYEERQWHSSSVNDYANSTIKSYLDSTFYNLLSTSAKTAVKQVKIPYRPGSGTSKTCNTGANGLSCKVFLLSGEEVGFTSSDASLPTNEGAKLSYFLSGTTTSSAMNKRIAKLNGTATIWWLRSPNGSFDGLVVRVDESGHSHSSIYYPTSSFGIRPCFIINSDTLFDPNTNVIK